MVAAPIIVFLLIAPVSKRHQFLGPGGPNDPFASDPLDD
jgi:hypothetical protein